MYIDNLTLRKSSIFYFIWSIIALVFMKILDKFKDTKNERIKLWKNSTDSRIQSEKTFHKQQVFKLINGHPVTLEQGGKNKARRSYFIIVAVSAELALVGQG